MRKMNTLWFTALALALVATLTLNQVNTAAAQNVPPVGVVVDYVPGQSITIVDQAGSQQEYMLSSSLKILPPGRANLLAVGSFVTLIAPNSISSGKQVAVGIVIHSQVPNGWNTPSLFAAPLSTATSATFTATPTGTLLATETVTATSTATETPMNTVTSTNIVAAAAVEAFTDTPAATATPLGGKTAPDPNSFIEWLRSLFRQVLSNR
jgi:hypothetical protein